MEILIDGEEAIIKTNDPLPCDPLLFVNAVPTSEIWSMLLEGTPQLL
jgi:hypothetical protein